MNEQHFVNGHDRIWRAISPPLKRGQVGCSFPREAAVPDAKFTITVGSETVEERFTYEEIEDCHADLTELATMKIRRLETRAAQLPNAITSKAFGN